MIMMRIFVACADERLRIALLLLLDNEPGMLVVGISDRLQGLLAQIEASQPDVLVLEWEIPIPSMIDLVNDIHKLGCKPKIVYLSSKTEEEAAIMAAGADHFIPMNVPPDELISILNTIKLPENKKETTNF
jgi:DNA-binding NarL/FixJ family response regulator